MRRERCYRCGSLLPVALLVALRASQWKCKSEESCAKVATGETWDEADEQSGDERRDEFVASSPMVKGQRRRITPIGPRTPQTEAEMLETLQRSLDMVRK